MPSDRDPAHALTRRSFGPNAAAYSTSAVHATSAALARLIERVAPRPRDRVLDVATGAGHVALGLAPSAARVIAADLTIEMLGEVRRNAAARGVTTVSPVQTAAEALPFRARAFDVVTCRLATHHFAALPAALVEMRRVLAPAGRLGILDTTVPEDDALDRAINDIELLRDPSHVRNHRASEWRALLARAGLHVRELDACLYDDGPPMSFAAWTARVRTPPEALIELRRRFAEASPPLRDVLRIRPAGDDFVFELPRVLVIATVTP